MHVPGVLTLVGQNIYILDWIAIDRFFYIALFYGCCIECVIVQHVWCVDSDKFMTVDLGLYRLW